jgi:hypothetical protein
MFLVYTWTVFTSFWKMPSWLFFLQLGEIVSIYAYAFVVNFVESILLLVAVLLPGLILPDRWWKDVVVPRGLVLILVILGSAALHLSLYRTPDTREIFVRGQFVWWMLTLFIAVLLTWLAGSVAWIRRGLENIAERFLVFIYVYLPLTVVAFLIVIARLFL